MMLSIHSIAVLIVVVLEWQLVQVERHTLFAIAEWKLALQELQGCWIPSQVIRVRNWYQASISLTFS
jgi:hypothetical protein